jgi:Bacterial type II and III secretion system protein
MKNNTMMFMLALVVTVASAGVVAQDQKQPPAKAQDARQVAPPTPSIPLQLQIVISTSQGEKKISSVPYVLSVNAVPRPFAGRAAQLRLGTRVPVPTTKPPTIDGKSVTDIPGLASATSFTYQDIGTNIDCSAFVNDDGRFELTISIEDSSIREEKRNELPLIRMFRLSNQVVVLRDGQSTQFTAATDRISGEVIRVDVTLNAVK